uniref:Uncharacterized protein n=1 Tax=Anguilla anguilla TaxID=7936 RepID=A0A0E9RD49_ANGAN
MNVCRFIPPRESPPTSQETAVWKMPNWPRNSWTLRWGRKHGTT